MKITYRPEIDGLRAIAVVAVILYHAQFTILGHQTFKGGFIGVDIFFVISGYLITSIILKELVTTGSFSFKHFYERRIRRLLPALLFVMLVSLPFAWMYLLPSSFVDFSKSILYSLGYSSNFYFYLSEQNYGDITALLKPFLHTWSLSVEEQFYILFPVFLFVIFKYFRRYILLILLLGFLSNILLVQFSGNLKMSYPFIEDFKDFNFESYSVFVDFYFLTSRIFELLAGSILAYLEIRYRLNPQNKLFKLILPGIGLLLISYYIFSFNRETMQPSILTLFPIIGTCLVICFANKDEFFTKILSSKYLVYIGLISYSLYLWHYPIFSFLRITEFFQGNLTKLAIIFFVLIPISTFSYFFIEKPFRDKSKSFKKISLILISVATFLLVYNFFIISNEGMVNKRFKKNFPLFVNFENKIKNGGGYHNLLLDNNGKSCFIKKDICTIDMNNKSKKKIYLIGDSQAASISYDLKNKVSKKYYQFIVSSIGDCLYYPHFNQINIKTKKISDSCNNNYFLRIKKLLDKDNNSTVIFFGRFTLHLSNLRFNNNEGGIEKLDLKFYKRFVSLNKYKDIKSSFINSVKEIAKKNNVILVYPFPEAGWNIPLKMLTTFNTVEDISIDQLSTSYELYLKRNESTYKMLDSIKDINVYRVYPEKLFCNTLVKKRCITHNKTDIYYHDNAHPTLEGTKMINELIIKEIEKIEAKSN